MRKFPGPGNPQGTMNSSEGEPTPSEANSVVFLRSRRQDLMLDYSLVLASQDIPHEVDFDGSRYLILVPPDLLPQSRRVLHDYVRENRGFHVEITPLPLDLMFAPLLYLAWPTALHFAVRLSAWPTWWHDRGAANARRIVEGEWWRTLTATTLHIDHAHFLSNLFSGYFILNLLTHRIGIGTIMALGLPLSMLANALVAFTSGNNHVSIGFSTSVFTALGMLAGVETLHRPRSEGLRFRNMHPLLAAFAVALLIGIGENVDVKAHFFGFGLGALGGLGTRWLPARIAEWPYQVGLVIATYTAYALSWVVATGWF